MRHLLLMTLLLSQPALATELLLGMIASSDPKKSVALFGNTDGGSQGLHHGDTIKGWVVAGIDSRIVTLRRENRLIRLRAGDLLNEDDRVAITTGIERQGTTLRVSPVLRDYIAGENLLTVLMQAGAAPVTEGDNIIGFSIYEIDPGSVYELAGLENEDVVTHVDGVELTSPLTALSMLKKIASSDSFSFTTLRRGISQTTSVQVSF